MSVADLRISGPHCRLVLKVTQTPGPYRTFRQALSAFCIFIIDVKPTRRPRPELFVERS